MGQAYITVVGMRSESLSLAEVRPVPSGAPDKKQQYFCRADVVPRVSYASVETAFLELVNASPVRTVAANLAAAGQKVTEGIKVKADIPLCNRCMPALL